MSELEDRRQRAREAAQDSGSVTQSWALGAIDVGIEVATRVKITEDIISAATAAIGRGYGASLPKAIEAAFRAAGFEVVE